MELPSNRLFNCKILAGIFALAFMILLPPSGYLDTAIDDLSMIVFFLLSVSVDKDDDHCTLLFQASRGYYGFISLQWTSYS